MLFKRAIPCMNDCGFSFEQISLKGANEEMYDLYQAARFINDGTTNLTLCDLAEPEIVCDYIVKLVMDASLINKYGEEAFRYKMVNDAIVKHMNYQL